MKPLPRRPREKVAITLAFLEGSANVYRDLKSSTSDGTRALDRSIETLKDPVAREVYRMGSYSLQAEVLERGIGSLGRRDSASETGSVAPGAAARRGDNTPSLWSHPPPLPGRTVQAPGEMPMSHEAVPRVYKQRSPVSKWRV